MQEHISCTEEISQLRETLEKKGKKLVLTNGCFDLLHVGHIRYLKEAKRLGDLLVVALNADTSVRELKGPGRPIYPLEERAEILGALDVVDKIISFTDKRLTSMIRSLRPHVYAKGGDYTLETLDAEEKKALESVGAEIVLLTYVAGKSTTEVLKRTKCGC